VRLHNIQIWPLRFQTLLHAWLASSAGLLWRWRLTARSLDRPSTRPRALLAESLRNRNKNRNGEAKKSNPEANKEVTE